MDATGAHVAELSVMRESKTHNTPAVVTQYALKKTELLDCDAPTDTGNDFPS
jgi:hypothetical protein